MSESAGPGIAGVHHVSLTVADLEASLDWYQRVFRTERLELTFSHYGCEETATASCCRNRGRA
ncbi:hypothetical protein BH09ACT8_BH09ACT8_26260 [soil metagenome]